MQLGGCVVILVLIALQLGAPSWLVVTPVVTITHAITPPRPRARSHAGLPKDDFEARVVRSQ